MNTVLAWALSAILAASPQPSSSPSLAERPLREIGRVRVSAYCTSFTNHFNAAVVPILKNDLAVGSLDRSLDDLQRHLNELGGDLRMVDDRIHLAEAVHVMQQSIPRAQAEINALREGARLGSDSDRIQRMRDLAGELQRALDKHKQLAHDVGNIVHTMMDMVNNDPRDDMMFKMKHALSMETLAVAAPALTGAQPLPSSSPAVGSIKELLRWTGQRDAIDEAEGKAAAHADQIVSATCAPPQ